MSSPNKIIRAANAAAAGVTVKNPKRYPKSVYKNTWWPGGPSKLGTARGNAFRKKNIVPFTFYNGVKINLGVHKDAEPAYKAMDALMQKHGYKPHKTAKDGSWNHGFYPRPKRGGKSWSDHSYGTACDLNAPANPFTAKFFQMDFPPEFVNDVLRLRTNNGQMVFEWGGWWGIGGGRAGRKTDTMHWSVRALPADIATGIANSTEEFDMQELRDVGMFTTRKLFKALSGRDMKDVEASSFKVGFETANTVEDVERIIDFSVTALKNAYLK